jgi:hypothetical protein
MIKRSDHLQPAEVGLITKGLDHSVKMFDYADQEWAEIELSVQAARTDVLTEDTRQCLRRAGTVYRLRRFAGKERKQQQLTFGETWENIHGLTSELHKALVKINESTGKYGRLLKSLAKLQVDASGLAPNPPSLSPREDFYREIFAIWTDKLGGELRISRNAGTHKLGGPLVRFFQSVTRPILATDAPALESIAAIVNREKERREKKRCREHSISRRRLLPQTAGSVERLAATTDPRGYCTDLGPLRINPDLSVSRQVHDYIVERQKGTDVLHIVAVDADGTVLANVSGNRIVVSFPSELTNALHNASKKIVIHRSDSSKMGLQAGDIALLAYPAIEAIVMHKDGGRAIYGELTAEGRAILEGKAPEQARRFLFGIASDLSIELFKVLYDSVSAGSVSELEANMLYDHLMGFILSRAGILNYGSENIPRRRKKPCTLSPQELSNRY